MSDQTIEFVPLEDWFEELADEALDPLNILISDEENEETTMSTTTLHMNKTEPTTTGFDVKKWLATAQVVTNGVAATKKVIPTPEWLVLKSGVVCEENAFVVTAGVIKAARQIIDAIGFETAKHEQLVEQLHMQEQRAVATGTFNIDTVGGYNPDGNEYAAAIEQLASEIEKVESVLANGERLITEVLDWIRLYAEELNLRVCTGYTTKLSVIGGEIRTPKYELLSPDTLMFGIAEQRDFIRSNRR